MAIKPSSKASCSKRTTAGSSAKASTTGPKPASPRTRVQKAQEATAITVQADENIAGPSTAMDVVPRYVRVPFGRTNRPNYQQARASAARKDGLPQPPTTPAPTAMDRPPLTMFDVPTKVVLPTVTRCLSRSSTQSDINAPVVPNNTGADTDKAEETDPETPRTTVHQQPSGDATDTEDVDENGDNGEIIAPSFLSFVAGLDGDATDAEEYSTPTPTPAPRNVQHGVSMTAATISSAPELGNLDSPNDVSFMASEPQTFSERYGDHPNAQQNTTTDMRSNRHPEAPPLINSSPDILPYTPVHQWNLPQVPTNILEQPSLFFPASFQPHTTAKPLAHTGTDFDLAARLNQLSVQATSLPNNFGEYAQVHPDVAAAPIAHVPAPAGFFYYEAPAALPPFASIWFQSLGLHYPNPAPLQYASTATHLQTQEFQPCAPAATKLFQSAPASCLPGSRRERPHVPSVRTKIYHDPQPEWQAKMEEMNERKSMELAQSLNPFHRMIGPRRWDHSGGKRGLLYIAKPGEEEPRKCRPLPARAQTKRTPRPAKGSEEDLIERIEYARQLEAKEARRAAKKVKKQMECALPLVAGDVHRTEKKAKIIARKNAKRSQRSSDEETSTSSGHPAKKRKTSY